MIGIIVMEFCGCKEPVDRVDLMLSFSDEKVVLQSGVAQIKYTEFRLSARTQI